MKCAVISPWYRYIEHIVPVIAVITVITVIAVIAVCSLTFLTPAAARPDLKIGVITDIGPVDDRSFNQSAWEGAKIAADTFGGIADFIETTDPSDYANNIALFAEQGYNVIITVGFALGDATLAAARKYPQVHFIAVDVDADALMRGEGVQLPNVTGLTFPEQKTGFLAGLLAARMSRSGIIGAVLPAEITPVVRFKQGFEAGAKHARLDIRVLATYHPGGLTVAFDDPAWGAQTAAQAIDQGADVIFSGGGKTGNGGLQEVARRTTPEKPLYCIGVDTDQWYTVPEAQPCLLTSGLKLISEGVVGIIEALVNGTLKSGNYVGEIGLAPFHDFEGVVPAEVVAELESVRSDLLAGRLNPDGMPSQ